VIKTKVLKASMHIQHPTIGAKAAGHRVNVRSLGEPGAHFLRRDRAPWPPL
jgi:hypothetical protein